jgi:hypothetical protein
MDIATPQGKDSADDYFFNPLSMHAVYASVWNISSTFLYCFPVTILEWKSGHVFVLPPGAKLESPVSHRSFSLLCFELSSFIWCRPAVILLEEIAKVHFLHRIGVLTTLKSNGLKKVK